MTYEEKKKKVNELLKELKEVADCLIVMAGCDTDDGNSVCANNMVKGTRDSLGQMFGRFISLPEIQPIVMTSFLHGLSDVLEGFDEPEKETKEEDKKDSEITVAKIPVDSEAGKKLMELVKGFENA